MIGFIYSDTIMTSNFIVKFLLKISGGKIQFPPWVSVSQVCSDLFGKLLKGLYQLLRFNKWEFRRAQKYVNV